MARCGCGTNSISAGGCVTLSGLGTAASPYVLSLLVADDPANQAVCTTNGLMVTGGPPPTPPLDPLAIFAIPNDLTLSTIKGRFRLPYPIRILGVSAALDTPPTGSPVIFDLKKNGVTVYSTPGNRPTVPIASHDAPETVPDITAGATGDHLTVAVAQIGAGTPGADATIFVRYTNP